MKPVGHLFPSFLLGLASAYPVDHTAPAPFCDCAGTKADPNATLPYICGDYRLGPADLPEIMPLVNYISNYDRFGGLSPGEFLAKWTNAEGKYNYPPQNGFQLDANGNAINGSMILEAGTFVDRFGSENGTYISAASAPYSQRALPPSSLNTQPSAPDFPFSYHVYQVVKPFKVVGGPIAPWFGQPGLGAQFYTGGVGNVLDLIAGGYLERADPSSQINDKEGCGQ
ncbi:unnamed protein product [Clonostachys byssicola]|uniref:TNT domain-containing protein n=1 Tax=Clonostachys byssicola TaxID=160290 RepID=A0A9N9U2R1_9HYPO|nr:unnamed protein product [Clonostachys byssicola]